MVIVGSRGVVLVGGCLELGDLGLLLADEAKESVLQRWS